MADKKGDGEFYVVSRPPALSKGQQIAKFLYNGETHEVLGRTAKSWCKWTFLIP